MKEVKEEISNEGTPKEEPLSQESLEETPQEPKHE
jgi:hypothetical protein